MSPERRETINFWADLLLRFLLAGGIIYALIQFTLFINDTRRDMRQSQVKHDAILQLADRSLKDHERFLTEHQRMLDGLGR
jgi:hypothetical protein